MCVCAYVARYVCMLMWVCVLVHVVGYEPRQVCVCTRTRIYIVCACPRAQFGKPRDSAFSILSELGSQVCISTKALTVFGEKV